MIPPTQLTLFPLYAYLVPKFLNILLTAFYQSCLSFHFVAFFSGMAFKQGSKSLFGLDTKSGTADVI